LIIREQNIGEQDKLLHVLTKSHGVVKAFARGAKNLKNGKSAATALPPAPASAPGTRTVRHTSRTLEAEARLPHEVQTTPSLSVLHFLQ